MQVLFCKKKGIRRSLRLEGKMSFSVWLSSYHLGFKHVKNTKRPVHLTAGPQLVILTRTFSKVHAANYMCTVVVADRAQLTLRGLHVKQYCSE